MTDEEKQQLIHRFNELVQAIPVTVEDGSADDAVECAYVRLRGAVERLLLVLNHRSERNYDAGMEAVERCMENFRVLTGKRMTLAEWSEANAEKLR